MDRRTRFIEPFVGRISDVYRVLDAVVILAALCCALRFRHIPQNDTYLMAAFCGCLFYMVAAGLLGLYRNWMGGHLGHECRLVAACWALSVVGILALGFALKRTAELSRIAVGAWFLTTPLVLCTCRTALRYALRWLRLRGIGTRTAVVAGAMDLGYRITRILVESPWMGYRVKGIYDDRKKCRTPFKEELNVPLLGTLDDLVRHADNREFDTVFIALPLRAEERIRYIVDRLGDTAVSVYFAPNFFAFDLIQSRAMLLGGIPVVSLFESPFSETLNRWAKRVEDLTVASLALAVLAVPMALIAVGVKLSSPAETLRVLRRGNRGLEVPDHDML
jgi:putative colanic acid biosynthesis UDP-glucose lipid carrier transferase